MTPYELHVKKWKNCTRCPLHNYRKRIVLVRGVLPAEVLFIGEAPGYSENALGRPFAGPAGRLLDAIIQTTQKEYGEYSYAITNLVACLPLDEKRDTRIPTSLEVNKCSERLAELMRMAKPKAIIHVGLVAAKHNPHIPGVVKASIIHPAGILRMNKVQEGLAIDRCLEVVKGVLETIGYPLDGV